MAEIEVGVLRGGRGHEYEVSLRTGQAVLNNLPPRFRGRDIFIAQDGTWHLDGLPAAPARAAKQVDVFFNALHGEYGEDGKVQSLLDALGAAYTGSGTFASAVAMKKEMAKEIFRRRGLKTPQGVTFRREEFEAEPPEKLARRAFERVGPPWVVKPADRGSSVGVFAVKTYPELPGRIAESFNFSDNVLVEEYLRGREATAAVVENFRNREEYVLPVIEIRRPGGKAIWEYDDKYSGATEEVCPGCFAEEEKRQLEHLAAEAHRALGLRHYSRSDFILSPRGIYLLETNTLPGLTTESLLPRALGAVGVSYGDFLDHILSLALAGRR